MQDGILRALYQSCQEHKTDIHSEMGGEVIESREEPESEEEEGKTDGASC